MQLWFFQRGWSRLSGAPPPDQTSKKERPVVGGPYATVNLYRFLERRPSLGAIGAVRSATAGEGPTPQHQDIRAEALVPKLKNFVDRYWHILSADSDCRDMIATIAKLKNGLGLCYGYGMLWLQEKLAADGGPSRFEDQLARLMVMTDEEMLADFQKPLHESLFKSVIVPLLLVQYGSDNCNNVDDDLAMLCLLLMYPAMELDSPQEIYLLRSSSIRHKEIFPMLPGAAGWTSRLFDPTTIPRASGAAIRVMRNDPTRVHHLVVLHRDANGQLVAFSSHLNGSRVCQEPADLEEILGDDVARILVRCVRPS